MNESVNFIRVRSHSDLTNAHGYRLVNMINNVMSVDVIIPEEIYDEDGNLLATSMYVSIVLETGENALVVKTIRPPLTKEWEEMVKLWILMDDQLVSRLETDSTIHEVPPIEQGNHIEERDSNCLGILLTKRQHAEWVESMRERGWTYHIKLCEKHKQHPLIRPWDELPLEFRQKSEHRPFNFLSYLAENGYTIILQTELDKLVSDFNRG